MQMKLVTMCLTWGIGVWMLSGCDRSVEPVLSGIVEVKDVRLGFEENGALESVGFDVNDKVEKGRVVAALQSDRLRREAEAMAYELEEARFRLKSLLHSPREDERKAAKARAAVAKALYEHASAELRRSRELHAKNAQSELELRRRVMEHAQAKGNFEAAEAEAALIAAGPKEEELDAWRMQIAALEKKLDAMEIRLKKRHIEAPFTGIVLTRNFEPGEFVRAGQAVVSLADMAECWVHLYVPESMYADLSIGQSVEVRFDSKRLPVFEGNISEIAQKAAFAPRMNLRKEQRSDLYFPVKIAVDNRERRLKPGMIADVTFRH